jgi:hypothetical protein
MSEDSAVPNPDNIVSIEGDMPFPDGFTHYLARWATSSDPTSFTWHPTSFFAGRPDLVSRYWFEKYSQLREAATQTDSRIFVLTRPRPPMPDDPFADFQTQTCIVSSPELDESPIPYKILDYSSESHSFRVLMADQRDEQQMSERVLLTTSPLLVADFLLNREKSSNG